MTEFGLTPDEIQHLDEAQIRLTLFDWLVASRQMIDVVAMAMTLAEESPELLRATPVEYIRFLRERLTEMEALLAATQRASTAPANWITYQQLQARYDEVRDAARSRVQLQKCGIDPDEIPAPGGYL